MIINLSLSIVSMGAIRVKDSRSTAIDFINWLKSEELNPSARFPNPLTKTEDIVDLMWDLDFSKYGYDHTVSFSLNVNWGQPEETTIGGSVFFHTDSNQFSVRINILPPQLVKHRNDYDELAKTITFFAQKLHKKINAKITFIDKNSTRLGGKAYNFRTLPLWIGWYSLYNSEIKTKYTLIDKNPLIDDLQMREENHNFVMYSNKNWAEYHRYGWNAKTKDYLKSIGGRLLHK